MIRRGCIGSSALPILTLTMLAQGVGTLLAPNEQGANVQGRLGLPQRRELR